MSTFTFRAKIWLHDAEAAWHFVTLPKTLSKKIRTQSEGLSNGWGSLKVSATIGRTTWSSSIFPDRRRGAYLLPIKADVRRAEKLVEGSRVAVAITVRALPTLKTPVSPRTK